MTSIEQEEVIWSLGEYLFCLLVELNCLMIASQPS
jgi:hypothetical protein